MTYTGFSYKDAKPATFSHNGMKNEIAFGKWFMQKFGRTLWPDEDWLDKKTNILFEMKEVQYTWEHISGQKFFTTNLVSLQRHFASKGRYRRVYYVWTFSDGTRKFASVEDIYNAQVEVPHEFLGHSADRPTTGLSPSLLKDIDQMEL